MKNKNLIFSRIISFVLIAAMALTFCSCTKKSDKKSISSEVTTKSTNATEVGTGKKTFNFNVFDEKGDITSFVVHSDEKTVGDALQKLKLIKGDKSDYGLYVKEVNGITADYDKDGTFWAFYIDGEMANSGADATEITENATYDFKVQK